MLARTVDSYKDRRRMLRQGQRNLDKKNKEMNSKRISDMEKLEKKRAAEKEWSEEGRMTWRRLEDERERECRTSRRPERRAQSTGEDDLFASNYSPGDENAGSDGGGYQFGLASYQFGLGREGRGNRLGDAGRNTEREGEEGDGSGELTASEASPT